MVVAERRHNGFEELQMVDAAAGTTEGTEETHQRPRLRQRLLRIGVRA